MSLRARLGAWLGGGRLGNVDADSAEVAALQQVVGVGEVDPADADRRAVDGWVDDPAKRYPPLAHDPRVASRTASAHLLGYPGVPGLSSGDAGRLSERYWGVDTTGMPHPDATANSLEAAKQSWQQTRPGDAAEALRWADAVAGPSGTITVDGTTGELWYEVVALRFQCRSLAVVEQLATFYRAQALDAQGQPTGDLFVGTSCAQCDDLLARPLHGAGPVALAVRWKLMRTATVEDAPRVVAAPLHHLPAGDSDFGLPATWDDLRFAWGGKYTNGLRCVVPGDGGSTIRLFVGLEVVNRPPEGASTFAVQVRGRLAGWSQVAGPLGSALAAAQARD